MKNVIKSHEFRGFSFGKSVDPIFLKYDENRQADVLAIFRKFPVFMGCTDGNPNDDFHTDMFWLRDSTTGEIFVRPIIDPKYVYLENHNEVVGQVWREHHQKFGEFVAKHLTGEIVFEIGGAHGMASLSAIRVNPEISWIIQDLNPIPVPEYIGKVVKGSFGEGNSSVPKSCTTIAHSHTLEHVHDQFNFMASINSALEIGARQIFSWPNMDMMLKKYNLSFLNFEHTVFLPISRVLSLLDATGFEVLEISHFHEHSIFIAAEKVSGIKGTEDSTLPPISEFLEYFEKLSLRVDEINKIVSSFDGQIFLFGAHIFSQMLIAAGLDIARIKLIFDNASHKHGKRLYGTTLEIESPEKLFAYCKSDKRILVIAAVGEYFSEVEKQIHSISKTIEVIGLE